MALIQKIRSNSWLLIVVIGLALVAFIMMDSDQGGLGGSVGSIGEIEGREIGYEQFIRTNDAVERMLYNGQPGSPLPRREALWNFYVEESILKEEAEEIGLGVSKEELMEAQFGPNYAQIIRSRFQGQVPGMVDTEALNQFRDAIANNTITDPMVRRYWAHQENEVIKERLQTKLGALVEKGLYTPTWMAESVGQAQGRRIDFEYVQIPFDEIESGDIALQDSDYANYLQANRARYTTTDETRAAEYVIINVNASKQDSADVRNAVAKLGDRWGQAENDTTFLQTNQGQMDGVYYTRDQVSEAVRERAFSEPVGSLVGPFLDGNAYRMAKIMGRKIVPDSVTAQHILLKFDRERDPIQLVQPILARADSIKTAIENGSTTFDAAAATFSEDASNAPKGGDLGTFQQGRMVPEFNNAAFYGEPGEIQSVITQFGIHLIKVNDQVFTGEEEESVSLAYVGKNIVPGRDTKADVENRALSLMEKNRTLDKLRAAVDADPELELQSAPTVNQNDYTFGTLGVDDVSRQIVKEFLYAQDTEAGDVSGTIYRYQDPIDFYDNRYVIVGMKEINAAGLPPVAAVRDQIEPLVVNEKKGAMIKEQLAGMNDLRAIASKYSVDVDTAQGVNFEASFIGGLGNEPKVLATAYGTAQNSVSQPVVGNNGVYVLRPISDTGEIATTNVPGVRQNTQNTSRAGIPTRLLQALKKNAEVQDNRSRFF